MNTSKHTPTPWYAARWTSYARNSVLADDASMFCGKRVTAECDNEEDAAFVVRACNSHEQLIAALREAEGVIAEVCVDQHPDSTCCHVLRRVRAALAALAAAGAA